MRSPSFIRTAADIPKGPYYIYGAGAAASSLQNSLEAGGRPAEHFRGYLTSFAGGEIAGAPIYNITQHATHLAETDTIVIANQYAREIGHHLQDLGVCARVLDGIMLVFRPAKAMPADARDFAARADAILPHLASDRSRAIYSFLARLRFNPGLDVREDHADFYAFMDRMYGQNDTYIRQHYFEYGSFKETSLVIEGGGNLGFVTRAMLRAMSAKGRIVTFEPASDAIATQSAHLQIHADLAVEVEAGRYTQVPKALWRMDTDLHFLVNPANLASSRVVEGGAGGQVIEATSIDSYCATNTPGKVDFIKLDVEGAEPMVIEGARNILKHDRPRLAVSIYHGPEQFVTLPERLIELLPGYRFEVGHHSNSPWLETVLYCLPD
ncbi:FkbM family methyltransferase [Gimibacter soli]|uniref:FkbM family methyltransferase n=1 Tax=Gimibacter soli TaxID=3024400 RepID=A0AAE9XUZ9_9PROT|nr:FkbM family methyltransferase [Gimibacter soli]WCL55671.1 FkbM family methyltransferase [Gimibacter soli]